MKKTIFFQKIIDSRFFAKWDDDKTKLQKMEDEINNRIKVIDENAIPKSEYCKHSDIFKVWNSIPWELETDNWNIQYRVNYFITPKKETTYNDIYKIANSVWWACYFKFL